MVTLNSVTDERQAVRLPCGTVPSRQPYGLPLVEFASTLAASAVIVDGMAIARSFTLLLLSTLPLRAEVDFARDVLPILSENCFHCHGPDEKARKGSLRLDTKDGAFRLKKGVAVIVPGKSAESEVITRILSDDDDVMPPTDSNRKLTAKQKATLKQWVDEGAKWGQHWAYVPLPKTVLVPKYDGHAIDAFIVDKLKKEKLAASPAASREAWLRRVTFDLTGLPPTLKEIEDFRKDTTNKAFESVVDRLLASPRYGERMASDWLDLARFADTHGYQSDKHRAMWPYRDWVIASFNRNQKFNRFLTEQLAGDLLPNATKDQKLATAFNRLHMQNEEGGIVEEEFRVAYVVDRVNTMGTAFLGQTFECCRCHDHKYDPLSQKEYYSLFAFFQNIDESGQTSYFTNAMNTPALLLSTPEQETKIKELTEKVREAERRLKTVRELSAEAFEAWQKSGPPLNRETDTLARYMFGSSKSNAITNEIPGGANGKLHHKVEFRNGGILLDGENGVEFPGVGHFTKSDPFSIKIRLSVDSLLPRAVVLHHSKAPVDAGSRGYELLLEDGHVSFGLHHMWPGNSLKVRSKAAIKAKTLTGLAITYDGSSRAEGLKIYIDGEPAAVEIIRNTLTKDITYGGGEPNLTLGYRFRDNGFKGGFVDKLSIYNRVLLHEEIPTQADRIIELFQQNGFKGIFLAHHDKLARERTAELREARRELAKFVEPIPEAMVMQELPKPKPAFLLKRGAYDAIGEPVSMNTPSALPPFPAELPRNRLGLATWLTAPDHPLTARVTVNRLWQQMFGRGLVETADNFGTTGTPPTHPELLDWLARDFVDHDWDVKRTLKQIALSNAYRQSSKSNAELRAKDPYNLLLAHAPVRRLSAEMLRDQALFNSGLLSEKLGGASVYPYQPAGLWNEAMGRPQYPQSKGAELYRRSLYTYWKRTAPPPTMVTFDAADRSNCAAKRQSTSTPLQALVLLNDPTFVEAARVMAEKLMKTEVDAAKRIATAFATVIGREPTVAELKVLNQLLVEQKMIFEKDLPAAEKLLAVGASKRDSKLNAAEHAAMTQLVLTLYNHDVAVNRR